MLVRRQGSVENTTVTPLRIPYCRRRPRRQVAAKGSPYVSEMSAICTARGSIRPPAGGSATVRASSMRSVGKRICCTARCVRSIPPHRTAPAPMDEITRAPILVAAATSASLGATESMQSTTQRGGATLRLSRLPPWSLAQPQPPQP
ncbi:hypothetical protein Vafri_2295, partial [Volvox africanus]